MTTTSAPRHPTMWHGQGIARETAGRLTAGRDTVMIVDSALSSPLLADAVSATIAVDARSADAEVVGAIAREVVRLSPEVILAVGGGSILDASKIAALALGPARLFDYAIGHASTSALTYLPDAPPPVDIVAVPTTLGTSSETNSVGVMRNERGYRLIMGRALRPRHAIIDASHLATLPITAVREGALEAFLRLAGASTGPRRSTAQVRDAVVLGRALLQSTVRDSASAAGRLRIARLSAATQRGSALRGPDPYSVRHWYVANEVAFRLGVRKMVATAATVAAVWRRICADDRRWGDRTGLEDYWTAATGTLGLPVDPADGIDALLDRWEIPRAARPADSDLDRIAVSIEKTWGNRRPMLAGLRAQDVRDVLRDSRWGAPQRAVVAGPRHEVRRR